MSKTYQIGQFDRRIEIIKFDYTKKLDGGPQHDEVSLGEFWALREDLSGTEEISGAVIALNVRKYVVQYQDILADDGVTFYIKDGGEYNIHSVEHVGRHEFLILKASRRE